MKILITSDTHGYYSPISDYIISNPNIDLLIHAGDGVEDAENIGYETGIKYYVVKGNTDFFSNTPNDKIIEVENHRIFLSHGHKYNIDLSCKDFLKTARIKDCDIAIHGHTHTYFQREEEGILLINPGSISLPRDNNPGFLIMDLEGELIKIERIMISEVD